MSLKTVAIALCLLCACIRWPDAPWFDTTPTLSTENAARLQAAHPGATLSGRVYRMHRTGGGTDRIEERRFLFRDAAGDDHRGMFDKGGALSVAPVELSDGLPEKLRARFFDGASAVVPEGAVAGSVWKFTDPTAGDVKYEFEYAAPGRRGLGSISESGNSRSAHDFPGATDQK